MKLLISESTGFVSLISRTLNKKVSILKFPTKLVLFITKLGELLPLPINSDRLEKIMKNFVVSNDKIKQGLQIEMLPISTSIFRSFNTFSYNNLIVVKRNFISRNRSYIQV